MLQVVCGRWGKQQRPELSGRLLPSALGGTADLQNRSALAGSSLNPES
jgi:hypothetical protein